MLITVRRVTGRTVVVEAAATDTIAALREKVAAATGIPVAQQLLTLCGVVIGDGVEDARTRIGSLGLDHHSVLQLAIRRATDDGGAAATASAAPMDPAAPIMPALDTDTLTDATRGGVSRGPPRSQVRRGCSCTTLPHNLFFGRSLRLHLLSMPPLLSHSN